MVVRFVIPFEAAAEFAAADYATDNFWVGGHEIVDELPDEPWVAAQHSTQHKRNPLRALTKRSVAFDTETTGLWPWRGHRIFAASFCDWDGHTAYIRWPVDPFTRKVYILRREWEWMRAFLLDSRRMLTMHHSHYDVRMAIECGLLTVQEALALVPQNSRKRRIQETMYAWHAVNNMEHSYGLKPLCRTYFGISTDDEKDLLDSIKTARRHGKELGYLIATEDSHGKDSSSAKKAGESAGYIKCDMFLGDPDLCEKYAVMDAERTMLLWRFAKENMEREGTRETYEREMALWPCTLKMECYGIRIDPDRVRYDIKRCLKKVAKLRKTIDEATADFCAYEQRKRFNPNSHPQLQRFLFGSPQVGGLGLPILSRTKGGAPSTDQQTLSRLDHPLLDAIQWYKAYKKAASGLFVGFLKMMGREDKSATPRQIRETEQADEDGTAAGQTIPWIEFPSLQQTAAATGRFNCKNPNLHGVSDPEKSRSMYSVDGRRPFVPRDGYWWILADYSQIEFRILAELAGETVILDAFREGRDPHGEAANRTWGRNVTWASKFLSRRVARLRDHIFFVGSMSDGTTTYWKDGAFHDLSKREQEQIQLWTPNYHQLEQLASDWLESWKYDVVAAEGSLGAEMARTRAKIMVYLISYGGGAPAAAKNLDTDEDTARAAVKEYHAALPHIHQYQRDVQAFAREHGYVITTYGRRLWVDMSRIYSATNYTIQGSAADQLKAGMTGCHWWLERERKERGLDCHLFLCRHDENDFEARKAHVTAHLLNNINRLMMDTHGHMELDYPVDFAITRKTWSRTRKVKFDEKEWWWVDER